MYKQFSSTSKKVYGSLHYLRNGAYSLPTNIRLLLINGFIVRLLDYVSLALGYISTLLDTKINRMLNSALR